MVDDYISPQPSIILEFLTSLRCGLCKVAHCLSCLGAMAPTTGYLPAGSVWDFVVLTSRYFWENWYIWLHTCILLFLLLFDEYSKMFVLLSCLHLVSACFSVVRCCFCSVRIRNAVEIWIPSFCTVWSLYRLNYFATFRQQLLGAIRWDSFCFAMHTPAPIFPISTRYFACALIFPISTRYFACALIIWTSFSRSDAASDSVFSLACVFSMFPL